MAEARDLLLTEMSVKYASSYTLRSYRNVTDTVRSTTSCPDVARITALIGPTQPREAAARGRVWSATDKDTKPGTNGRSGVW